jgi:hypothetical protein
MVRSSCWAATCQWPAHLGEWGFQWLLACQHACSDDCQRQQLTSLLLLILHRYVDPNKALTASQAATAALAAFKRGDMQVLVSCIETPWDMVMHNTYLSWKSGGNASKLCGTRWPGIGSLLILGFHCFAPAGPGSCRNVWCKPQGSGSAPTY